MVTPIRVGPRVRGWRIDTGPGTPAVSPSRCHGAGWTDDGPAYACETRPGREAGRWIAKCVETGATTQDHSGDATLANLDEGVVLHSGDIGREPPDEEFGELGIDPADNTTGEQAMPDVLV